MTDVKISIPEQKKVRSLPKNKKKSFKITSKSKLNLRLPSRQFSNPIYDGLNIQQKNTESLHFGPWTTDIVKPLKNSYSLNPKLDHVNIHPRSQSQYDLQNNNLVRISIIERTPSRSQLPTIKEKSKLILHDLKFGSSDLDKKHLIQKNMTEKKLKPKLHIYKKSPEYVRKDIVNYPQRARIGTVVYNYCANYNNEQSLLSYKRKSQDLYQNTEKQQESKIKLMGLKTYWQSKRSLSTGRFSEFFDKHH